jgi:hypothetical protein
MTLIFWDVNILGRQYFGTSIFWDVSILAVFPWIKKFSFKRKTISRLYEPGAIPM